MGTASSPASVTDKSNALLLQNKDDLQPHGLSVYKAWLFIVGEMAGMGACMFAARMFDVTTAVLLLIFVTWVVIYSGGCMAKTWNYIRTNEENLQS